VRPGACAPRAAAGARLQGRYRVLLFRCGAEAEARHARPATAAPGRDAGPHAPRRLRPCSHCRPPAGSEAAGLAVVASPRQPQGVHARREHCPRVAPHCQWRAAARRRGARGAAARRRGGAGARGGGARHPPRGLAPPPPPAPRAPRRQAPGARARPPCRRRRPAARGPWRSASRRGRARAPRDRAPGGAPRRVRSVRGEGRGVST